jgi:branched-chain amino acid aminotransferase
LELAREWGMKVSERQISIDEVFAAHANGTLQEAFGSGTAAVISPVGELSWKGQKLVINNNQTGPTSQKLFDAVTGMQYGTMPDSRGWVNTVTKL